MPEAKEETKTLGMWYDADCGHRVFVSFTFPRGIPVRVLGGADCETCGRYYQAVFTFVPPEFNNDPNGYSLTAVFSKEPGE